MATLARKKKSPNFRDVLEAALTLSPAERRRLKEELARSDVDLLLPDTAPEAIAHGRELAEQVRQELSQAAPSALDETMAALRGRKWSS